jgi:hypothetical protein
MSMSRAREWKGVQETGADGQKHGLRQAARSHANTLW